MYTVRNIYHLYKCMYTYVYMYIYRQLLNIYKFEDIMAKYWHFYRKDVFYAF